MRLSDVPMGPLPMTRAPLGDDHHIGYHAAGTSGTPVLLIMGYCVPGRAWRFQWPALSAHHRVAVFDNRGLGASGAPAGTWTMADFAADTLALMDHLSWERAHIVGVSMGGMIAQHIALHAPDRVRSLSLIATQAGGLRAMVPAVEGLKRFALANAGRPDDRGKHVARLLFPEPFIEQIGRPWLEKVLMDDFGEPIPKRTRRLQLGAIARHRAGPLLKRSRRVRDIPTLIVRPGVDLLIRPKESDRLAALLPHARVVRFDDAGHGVIRQQATALNEALLSQFAAADGA